MPNLFVVCCILIGANIDCFPVPLLCASMDCHSIHGYQGYSDRGYPSWLYYVHQLFLLLMSSGVNINNESNQGSRCNI